MMNLSPVPIDIEVILNDAALQEAGDIRVAIENQPATRQILDLIFERRGREEATAFKLLAKGFGVFRPLLNLLKPEGLGIGADRCPQNHGNRLGKGAVVGKFRS